jgi:hypothetical protein
MYVCIKYLCCGNDYYTDLSDNISQYSCIVNTDMVSYYKYLLHYTLIVLWKLDLLVAIWQIYGWICSFMCVCLKA